MVRGKFVVVDGLDGVGKGVFLDTLVEEARNDGRVVFNAQSFQLKHDLHPPLPYLLLGGADVILTAEPTFCGIGRYIRDELIAKNNRNYSAESVAGAYALDRRILYEKLILPALDAGISVYQSRSFSSSLIYQRQMAREQGTWWSMEGILQIPGNAFCYRHPMDYLVIPTIADVEEAVRRSQQREKQDECRFENLDFQLNIKPEYESAEFRDIFIRNGVKLSYPDAGKSLEFSKEQAREFYREKLR